MYIDSESSSASCWSFRTLRTLLFVSSAMGALTWGMGSARAQTQAADEPAAAGAEHPNILDEVVVTASRKRNEDVQSTPVAVTALNSDMLEQYHVTNFDQLGGLAPNLQLEKSPITNDLAIIYMRGFGTFVTDPSGEPHIAVFVDGIYQPATAGTLFDMFDIDQVEVDAGPQGTLAGKNAPVGAIYVTSPKPTRDFGGVVEADYGSYDRIGARAKVNVPLIKDANGDNILAMVASFTEKEGGNWVYNIANDKRDMGGENTMAGRVGVSFTPNSDFEWDVSARYWRDRDPQNGSRPVQNVPAVPGSMDSAVQVGTGACKSQLSAAPAAALNGLGCMVLPYGQTDSTYTTQERDDQAEVASTMTYKLSPVTLTLVNGFISDWLVQNADTGGTPYTGLNVYGTFERYDEETAEFRVSSNKGGGWDLNGFLDWVVGGYYSNFDFTYTARNGIGALTSPPYALRFNTVNNYGSETGTNESVAVFAHVIANFTDQWTGTFGVRESWDAKTHSYEAASAAAPYLSDPRANWKNNSFEFGTAYQFDANKMGYVRFAQGYEAGGFAGLALGNIYQPETDNTYEVGVKTDWLKKKLRVNLDVFQSDISNLQLASVVAINRPPGFLQQTLNAGAATIRGVESNIVAVPIPELTTHLTAGYLLPYYDRNLSTVCSNVAGVAANCAGLPFSFSPKWSLDLGASYLIELPRNWGTATLSANWAYKAKEYTFDPPIPASFQNGYGLLNLSMTVQSLDETRSIEFYGTNVLDRHYTAGFDANASGLFAFAVDGRPAEWGVKLLQKF